jgi:2-keto-4-pentenoate hydratase/2-oxohepta-3-ene-1,7-dioic acid hydratase in catechol pathway
MKLLRYGPPGREKPALLDGAGRLRDLSGHVGREARDAAVADALSYVAGYCTVNDASERHSVSYVSELMTLKPGDLITTGTPAGVGMGFRPPRYLQPGDVMSLGIDKLGTQRQRVVPAVA